MEGPIKTFSRTTLTYTSDFPYKLWRKQKNWFLKCPVVSRFHVQNPFSSKKFLHLTVLVTLEHFDAKKDYKQVNFSHFSQLVQKKKMNNTHKKTPFQISICNQIGSISALCICDKMRVEKPLSVKIINFGIIINLISIITCISEALEYAIGC